jgi:hypothetical protein
MQKLLCLVLGLFNAHLVGSIVSVTSLVTFTGPIDGFSTVGIATTSTSSSTDVFTDSPLSKAHFREEANTTSCLVLENHSRDNNIHANLSIWLDLLLKFHTFQRPHVRRES